MQIFHLNYPNDYKIKTEPTSMAVGYFDGVHKGHQEVINKAIEVAEQQNHKRGVMTFHPHPLSVLKGTQLTDFLITSLDEKIELFNQMDIDYLYIVEFNKDLAKLSPNEFVDKFFVDLNVKHVVGGFDFSFGHKGSGKIQQMDEYAGDRLTYSVVNKVTFEDEKISSTRIRETLDHGEMDLTEKLLGRPFSISAEVIKGHQRGRTIGYPTANLDISVEHKLPKVGIYAVRASVNGQRYFGMANIGYNPTFTNDIQRPIVEVYLFEFNKDIYGEIIEVEFYKYIRNEEKFNDVESLIERMKEDEKETKKFFQIQT
ncbi:bifunctional riboflavin kinase/FAD synthetase [Filobacillus milosensis]|uniref:bifunctional riboflavin kinase/FAD synthetase n=1 Tax=Filobacillus milosensis TaxID=94137 RepID=UPI0010691F14|nr:bifunctional riboflavin kinase/FAD synthetase [Filobacillus milosensis]